MTTSDRIYDQVARRIESTVLLPRHVRRAYRWTPLRDVFMDRRGRLWYADPWDGDTHQAHTQLPEDPESYEKIPPQFWHPSVRRARSREQHEAQKRALEDERALELVRD